MTLERARILDAARALRREGRIAEAIARLEDAIRNSPDDGEALAELAAAQWAVRRGTAAIETLRRAVALRPDDIELRGGLATALQATGRRAQAEAAFADALARAPGHLPTRLRATMARLAAVHRDEAEMAAARAAYARDLALLATAPLPVDRDGLDALVDAVGA
ncbi:MAG: tetratricopeptide repeat protein, partial [Alphaproteobacteria bacterium]